MQLYLPSSKRQTKHKSIELENENDIENNIDMSLFI